MRIKVTQHREFWRITVNSTSLSKYFTPLCRFDLRKTDHQQTTIVTKIIQNNDLKSRGVETIGKSDAENTHVWFKCEILDFLKRRTNAEIS